MHTKMNGEIHCILSDDKFGVRIALTRQLFYKIQRISFCEIFAEDKSKISKLSLIL